MASPQEWQQPRMCSSALAVLGPAPHSQGCWGTGKNARCPGTPGRFQCCHWEQRPAGHQCPAWHWSAGMGHLAGARAASRKLWDSPGDTELLWGWAGSWAQLLARAQSTLPARAHCRSQGRRSWGAQVQLLCCADVVQALVTSATAITIVDRHVFGISVVIRGNTYFFPVHRSCKSQLASFDRVRSCG